MPVHDTEVRRLMERLASGEPLKAGLRAMAVYLKGRLDNYPPPKSVSRASVYGQPFQSIRQQKWFFAALREGLIDVPYQRTGGLAKRWGIADNGLTQTIGNDAPQAPFVLGTNQSPFFEAVGWKRVDEIVDAESAGAAQAFYTAFEQSLRR
jgi:hypothetical protein